MALQRRSGSRFSANIWPGFVDAMTALLLVLMFVLTIFMIVQFVLRETISGQDAELNQLSVELAGLASSLGLEREKNADLETEVSGLSSSLSQSEQLAEQRQARIVDLTFESETQQSQIADFETQVAGLLAQNSDLTAGLAETRQRVAVLTGEKEQLQTTVAAQTDENTALEDQNTLLLADKEALEAANLKVISEKEALQLALVQARDEIDAEQEAARLSAAKREALEALIADLQTNVENQETSLASALAALAATEENLRSTEQAQTDATLNLEDTRTQLAETNQELIDTKAALQEANQKIAQSGLTADELRQKIADLDAGLTEAEKQKLADAAAAQALRKRLENAEDELTAMALSLEAQRKAAEDTLTLLAAAELSRDEALDLAGKELTEKEKQAALLAAANARLTEEEAISADSARSVALLNAQTTELRKQLDSLQGLLDLAQEKDRAAKVQIESLGSNLNTALAQVASEQKKVANEQKKLVELERIERERLEAEAKDLKKFRSEFFGKLRDVLGTQQGIRIVGDRFVFSSEILFRAGSAELGERGKEEIRKVAEVIFDVVGEIPSDIDWVLQVDGHTDKIPLGGGGRYRNNWELSQGRALSVVTYLIDDLGVPADRLSANGFGEYQPVIDGTSPEALALNRRIELKFTEK